MREHLPVLLRRVGRDGADELLATALGVDAEEGAAVARAGHGKREVRGVGSAVTEGRRLRDVAVALGDAGGKVVERDRTLQVVEAVGHRRAGEVAGHAVDGTAVLVLQADACARPVVGAELAHLERRLVPGQGGAFGVGEACRFGTGRDDAHELRPGREQPLTREKGRRQLRAGRGGEVDLLVGDSLLAEAVDDGAHHGLSVVEDQDGGLDLDGARGCGSGRGQGRASRGEKGHGGRRRDRGGAQGCANRASVHVLLFPCGWPRCGCDRVGLRPDRG